MHFVREPIQYHLSYSKQEYEKYHVVGCNSLLHNSVLNLNYVFEFV
jgi:hypothetical protein